MGDFDQDLCVASICMTSGSDVKSNLETAFGFIKQAKQKGAKLVVLPEMFPYLGPPEGLFDACSYLEKNDLKNQLKKISKDLDICLLAGSFPTRSHKNPKKVFNTSYFFDDLGHEISRYDKINLFQIASIGNQKSYDETVNYDRGDEVKVGEWSTWNYAMTICFDLRFSGLFSKLASVKWPDIIFVPSAFTLATGKDHWHTLLKARAIEWQSYVVASNQVGEHMPSKNSYGHSLIVDPWGNILSDTLDQEGIALAVLSKKNLYETRKRLDMRYCLDQSLSVL